MGKVKQYVYNTLVAVDETTNTLLGGAPSDTISGRAERGFAAKKPVWTQIHNVLDWLQKDHCEQALQNDDAGRHTESFKLDD